MPEFLNYLLALAGTLSILYFAGCVYSAINQTPRRYRKTRR